MGKKRKFQDVCNTFSDISLDYNIRSFQEEDQSEKEEIVFVPGGVCTSLDGESVESQEKQTLILSNDPVTKLDELLLLERARENIQCSSFKEFENSLLNYELDTNTKFIISKTRGSFTDDDINFTPKRIRWWNDGELKGAPYFAVAHRYYSCCYGVSSHSKVLEKYAKVREEKSKHGLCRRYKKYQSSKKLGCPVKFVAERLLIFPNFQISEDDDTAKEDMKIVKGKLIENFKSYKYESRYHCKLPESSSHLFHPTNTNPSSINLREPIERRVNEKIKLIVGQAVTNPDDVAEYLKEFLKRELNIVEKDTTKLIPSKRDLQLAINRAKLKIKNDSPDIDYIRTLSHSWGTEEEVYFRGMSENESSTNLQFPSSPPMQFLFVYQNTEMRRLFNLYGLNCVFLDAAHRSCGFIWPFYFLIVHTNQGYQVVGLFVTQRESRNTVGEALEIIRSWNPGVLPSCWLVNRPFEEIRGIEKVYPGIQVFTSTYHRSQVWKEKLYRKENDGVDRPAILRKLENVAEATSKKELQSALEELRADSSFQSSEFQEYYNNTWHLRLKRWVRIYYPNDVYFELADRLNKLPSDIQYGYLSELKSKTLSNILSTIINTYIPRNLFLYQRENIKIPLKVKYMDYCSNWVIDSMLKLYIQASQQIDDHIIEQIHSSSFTIISIYGGASHQVSINSESSKASCTCFYFKRKMGVICKHILMIGFKFPDYKFSVLSQWLFNDPLFRRDLECSEHHDNAEDSLDKNEKESPIDLDSLTPTLAFNNGFSPFCSRDISGENLLSEFRKEIKMLDAVCSQMNCQVLKQVLPKIKSIREEISANFLPTEDELAMNFVLKNEATITSYAVADSLRSFIKNDNDIDQLVIEIEN